MGPGFSKAARILHQLLKIFLPRLHRIPYIIIILYVTGFQAQVVHCPGYDQFSAILSESTELQNAGKTAEAENQLLKLASHAKSVTCTDGQLAAEYQLLQVYMDQRNYEKTLKHSQPVLDLAAQMKNYKLEAQIHTLRGTAYNQLGVYAKGMDEYRSALQTVQSVNGDDQRHLETAKIYYDMAAFSHKEAKDSVKSYLISSLTQLYYIKTFPEAITEEQGQQVIATLTKLADFHNDPASHTYNKKKAIEYFEQALKFSDMLKPQQAIQERAVLLLRLQTFYHSEKQYAKAIEFGTKALEFERLKSNPEIRKSVFMILARSYLADNDLDQSKRYLEYYTKLNDSLTNAHNRNSQNKTFAEKDAETDIKDAIITFLIVGFAAKAVIAVIYLYRRRKKKRALGPNYQRLLDKLEHEHEVAEVADADNSEESPQDTTDESERAAVPSRSANNISDDTLNAILKKLTKFEKSDKYLKKDINLTWLSNHLNTNTKYLSEIIKNHRSKNFNTYINWLRIRYITRMLYEDPVYREYKITYLAEECGYASPQVFVIAFKRETGVTPSYFIEQLKKRDGQ